jgi:acrylyl-CoA reductase (NADPH)/3-hydroxypropionyl-CoA dehydratase/3-hydroxypropionyl-CoA synthetase
MLVDYAVSQAGDGFGRSFQALAEGGAIVLHGASSGGHITFLGKSGKADPAAMLQRARLRPGETVVVYYGFEGDEDDATGLQLLKAIHAARGRIAVVTRTEAQHELVRSLGFDAAIAGVLSIEALQRREPTFLWREALPEPPRSQTPREHWKEAVWTFRERTVKPLGQALSELLRGNGNPRGVADVIIERARQDTLTLSALLARPDTGRILYCEDMAGRRYGFYAPPVCQRQCRILMPTASIIGTQLCNATEAEAVRRLVEAGVIEVPPVHLFDWSECPGAHQAIWEDRLAELTGGASNAMLNHALPGKGIQSVDELVLRWGGQTAQPDR